MWVLIARAGKDVINVWLAYNAAWCWSISLEGKLWVLTRTLQLIHRHQWDFPGLIWEFRHQQNLTKSSKLKKWHQHLVHSRYFVPGVFYGCWQVREWPWSWMQCLVTALIQEIPPISCGTCFYPIRFLSSSSHSHSSWRFLLENDGIFILWGVLNWSLWSLKPV